MGLFLNIPGFFLGSPTIPWLPVPVSIPYPGIQISIVSLQQPGFFSPGFSNSKIFILTPSISARECEMQSCLNVEVDGRRASTLSNFGGATGHASSQMINTVPHIR